MTTFFVSEVRFIKGVLDAARVCTPVPIGDRAAPDHMLSAGSVLALPELTALVEIAEVRLVIWNGPGPVDWFPIDQLVIRDSTVISVDEEGIPTNALQTALKTIAGN